MDHQGLQAANMALQQSEASRPKWLLWLIIGIVVSVIVIVITIVVIFIYNGKISTYPYIPTPKNTIRSISGADLISNLLLDANDTAVEYSVISRYNLIHGR